VPSKHNIIVRALVLTSLASLPAGETASETEADGAESEMAMWIWLISESMVGGRRKMAYKRQIFPYIIFEVQLPGGGVNYDTSSCTNWGW